jgi:uncharacterized protein (TIGR02996 family)
MREDDAFIKAIVASPTDDASRLVYADWLEERGDARGEYLRVELALAAARRQRVRSQALRKRLQELRAEIKPSWLAIFDQPGVLRANPTPFPAGWWSEELEGYREGDGTYDLYRYESLPPLPIKSLGRGFQWLNEGQRKRKQPARQRKHKKLDRLAAQATEAGLTLPREFREFMGNRALQRRVRSCTDCYFNWPRRIVESPAGEEGHLVRFYSDSQGCFHWYLYLTPHKYHCVVGSGGFFGGYEGRLEEDWEDESGDFWFCAPSFQAFVYRYWIENEIWYALSYDHDPLTAEEEAYLSHYRGK